MTSRPRTLTTLTLKLSDQTSSNKVNRGHKGQDGTKLSLDSAMPSYAKHSMAQHSSWGPWFGMGSSTGEHQPTELTCTGAGQKAINKEWGVSIQTVRISKVTVSR